MSTHEHLESLPFPEWVAHVFDHEVHDPQWYFDPDGPVWAAPVDLTLAYMTRLFNDPARYLDAFDDRTLNQGFWYLVSSGGSNHMFALMDTSAPLPARIRCVESFSSLFEKLFAVRCTQDLSHLNSPNASKLNLACYMWWDIIPLFGAPDDPSRRELDAAALSVMDETLSLDSLACRESALHGLGHWQRCYPERVNAIIDRAMSQSGWPPELVAYAGHARSGCVL